MDVDEERGSYQTRRETQPSYDASRTARAEPKIQDGTFGFNDESSRSNDYYEEERQNNQQNRRGRGRGGKGGGLVSDGMIRRQNGNSRW